VNALFLEHIAQHRCRPRLGKGARQRGGIHNLHLVADPALGEVPVRQEGEFQRRHRAFNWHFCDVNHQPPALKFRHELAQRRSAFKGVKIEDILPPARAQQAFNFTWADVRTRSNRQVIIVDHPLALSQRDPVLVWLNQFNIREHKFNLARQVFLFGLNGILRFINPKGDEQEPGLIIMCLVAVHHNDLPLFRIQLLDHVMSQNGSSRAATQNEECLHVFAPYFQSSNKIKSE